MTGSGSWFFRLQSDNPGSVLSYVLACLVTILVGAVTFPLREEMGLANVVMLFLLEVFLCALWLGQKPSLMAALLAVFLFDFFFVPPQYALLTNSLKYIVMLVVMLLIALLTGQMAARLLAQNRELQISEERTRSLYRMARELAGAADSQQVDAIAARYPTNTAAGSLLEIARQRLHYAELAQASHVQVESERLRNSILSSLSHDLRTPLTALVGLTETLHLEGKVLSPTQQEMVEAVHEQSVRLAGMVTKLLDLARLSAGKLKLNKEWQSLADVTGSALDLLEPSLVQRPVSVRIPADFPLLAFDAVLMERVIGNLLENAAKYTPAGSPIDITAQINGKWAEFRICDRGNGFAPPSSVAGLRMPQQGSGLGFTICEAILKAHGGELSLEQREGGGACACVILPLGDPPSLDEDVEEEFPT
ncbi:DUF4118 domain-containing protein [Candidatus Thiothrix sp. Deng01]|uniref:histidine kinase n=1 Tax=Candidatus Thiothrix phosphatis TaxID=3112415 RepID=A0ABU6CV12_9GAMM|nr:DUF4118 domain-containing protein [Candidatus Thiothrix sp. Deng01]MEB4590681.1 DUF4118 domain-containing protein [Candidatus Thiothrix sp. Deng01]